MIPIVRDTTCPSVAELADKSKHWAIVEAPSGRRFLGRVDLENVAPTGHVRIDDPFEYGSERVHSSGAIGMAYHVYPLENLDVDTTVVFLASAIALHRIGPTILAYLREKLVRAWDAREQIRMKSGRVELAGKDTTIESSRA